MVTIRELAEIAGVSHMAVWRTLQQQPGVSPELRARILELADVHHYHTNRLVEGLHSGRTRTIGVIVEHVTWLFYARLCNGVMNAASRDQAHVITLNLKRDDGEWHELPLLISQLIEQRVDGMLLAVADNIVPAKSLLEMWSHDIVPVLFETQSEKPLDRLRTDERQLAHTALDYLLSLGHQYIAYCGFNSRRTRDQEMRRAFHLRGISPEYFIEETSMSTASPRETEACLDSFLRMRYPPTAVICHNDHIAIQLLQRAQRRGLRVPGDLSILGCGNDIMCRFLVPPLTSIEQFPEEIGAHAYALIQRRHQEHAEPGERVPETIVVPPQLVIRQSCGPQNPRSDRSTRVSPDFTLSPNRPERTSSTMQDTIQDAEQVSPEMARLLTICTDVQSQQELMKKLGMRNRPYFSTAYLKQALDTGYIERTIPEKPCSKKQRYRLTMKGRAWVKERVKGEG